MRWLETLRFQKINLELTVTIPLTPEAHRIFEAMLFAKINHFLEICGIKNQPLGVVGQDCTGSRQWKAHGKSSVADPKCYSMLSRQPSHPVEPRCNQACRTGMRKPDIGHSLLEHSRLLSAQ